MNLNDKYANYGFVNEKQSGCQNMVNKANIS